MQKIGKYTYFFIYNFFLYKFMLLQLQLLQLHKLCFLYKIIVFQNIGNVVNKEQNIEKNKKLNIYKKHK
jgi:hypothetical protein